ncbi:MAG: response regulator transcription factor [Pseudomonadota bacterium]
MKKGNIFCIDDDESLQLVINEYLESDGYTILKAQNIQGALDVLSSEQQIDVILLDLGLPDGEGTSLIPKMQSQSDAAIIVVSGKNDTMEKIVCLEMGADDYITKPFEMRELSARIKAVMRRSHNNERDNKNEDQKENVELVNGWILNRKKYDLLTDSDHSANLTMGEFQLLEALVLSANRALSREHLFELTREGEYDSYDRAIDIQIARLRKKIGDDTKNPKIIKTIRGVGYMYATH